jgi:RND family efflux transporter MFP subunit
MSTNGDHPGPLEGHKKRWWTALGGVALFVLVGLVLVPGVVRREPAAPPAAAAPGPPRLREAGAPQQAPRPVPQLGVQVAAADDFDCMIHPNELVDIGSAVTGRIESIPVERSQYVEAGQVVATLDSSVEQAAVRVARARAERTVDVEAGMASRDLGQKRRARAVELFERNTVSLDLRDEVETKATLATLDLERARENRRIAVLELEGALAALDLRTIRSPVSGYVIERLMATGEVADERQTILRIAQVDPLRVEVVLPSGMFGRVRPGDRAEIVPEPPLDRPRSAEVSLVDPLIDGASGTLGARLVLPNPERDLPAGLRCRVRFELAGSARAQPGAAPSE